MWGDAMWQLSAVSSSGEITAPACGGEAGARAPELHSPPSCPTHVKMFTGVLVLTLCWSKRREGKEALPRSARRGAPPAAAAECAAASARSSASAAAADADRMMAGRGLLGRARLGGARRGGCALERSEGRGGEDRRRAGARAWASRTAGREPGGRSATERTRKCGNEARGAFYEPVVRVNGGA